MAKEEESTETTEKEQTENGFEENNSKKPKEGRSLYSFKSEIKFGPLYFKVAAKMRTKDIKETQETNQSKLEQSETPTTDPLTPQEPSQTWTNRIKGEVVRRAGSCRIL